MILYSLCTEFNLSPSIEAAVEKAIQSYESTTSSLGVHFLESEVFGKNECKKHKVSPDAMMQLGIQVVWLFIFILYSLLIVLISNNNFNQCWSLKRTNSQTIFKMYFLKNLND